MKRTDCTKQDLPHKRNWRILKEIKVDGCAKTFVYEPFEGVNINLIKDRK